MDRLGRRAAWALACLLACGVGSRAATGRAPEPLKQGFDQPETFKNYVDGTRTRAGLAVSAREGSAPRPGVLPPAPAARPQPQAALPPQPGISSEAFRRGGGAPYRSAGDPSIPNGLLVALALAPLAGCAALVAWNAWEETRRREALEPEPAAPGQMTLREQPSELVARLFHKDRLPVPAPLVARPARRVTFHGPVFDRPSAPAPAAADGTWHQISDAEQALLDRWDASPDKARGRVSFEAWLEAHGPAAGVNPALLKAKLDRQA